jgi:multidrug efflux system outer membrane protein
MLERISVKLALAMAVAGALAGCASTRPDYERPAIELPYGWSTPAGTSGAGSQWWKIYGDAALDRLVEEALAGNADLALAVARVDEARAQLGLAQADQAPSVDAGFNRSRQQNSRSTATAFPGVPREYNDYRTTLSVSYELDLWGRLRNATTAARADLLASESARETVRITLAADVAQAYFALRAYDEQIAATRRSLETRTESLGMQKKRLDVGAISEFDYRQIEAEAAAARAQLPQLERQRSQQENALAVLLGRSPKAIYEGAISRTNGSGGEPPALVVPSGLPSELLLRRPDLVQAEQRIVAQNARVAEARASLFPSISLTGLLGSESALLRNLFSGPAGLWSLAAAVAQPLYSGGRLEAGISAAQARERQALAQYQQSIQNAFREVRDAIVAQTKTREQFDAEDQRAAALRQALGLARLRYENGMASQLEVLDVERNLLAAEQGRADSLRAQRAAIADLFKALGGGWSQGS